MRTYEQSHEFPTDNMKKPVPEGLTDDIAIYREVAAQAEAARTEAMSRSVSPAKDPYIERLKARIVERRKQETIPTDL